MENDTAKPPKTAEDAKNKTTFELGGSNFVR